MNINENENNNGEGGEINNENNNNGTNGENNNGENNGGEDKAPELKPSTEGLEFVLASSGKYYSLKGIGTCTATDIFVALTVPRPRSIAPR